jgi:hypothetical protein
VGSHERSIWSEICCVLAEVAGRGVAAPRASRPALPIARTFRSTDKIEDPSGRVSPRFDTGYFAVAQRNLVTRQVSWSFRVEKLEAFQQLGRRPEESFRSVDRQLR